MNETLIHDAIVVTAIRYHSKLDVFSLHAVSRDPEAVHLIPSLAPPHGMVLDRLLTADDLLAHFGVAAGAVAEARTVPGQWVAPQTGRPTTVPTPGDEAEPDDG